MIDRRTFTGALFVLGTGGLLGCSKTGTNEVTADLASSRNTDRAPTIGELATEGPLGDRFLGRANAPVTVYEYVSLTCPYSRKFHVETYPRFKTDFIDTGKVRFVVREFPIGRSAAAAAVITRAAPKDQYFVLHEKFLLQQKKWTSQKVRPDAIFEIASQAGLSRQAFDNALNDQAINDGLIWVKQRGRELGVTGTPTFFANGQKRRGAVSYDEMLKVISI